MDALYLFCHSRADDLEIQYSLRSLAKHLPFIRKVWIFGDRPAFLSSDTSLIEHVPHEYAARLDRSPVPVRNTFKMLFLSSLIGDLTAGYLWMCDDYVLLEPLTEADVQRNRYVEDMNDVPVRGAGLYKEAMCRTHDVLKRLGYPVYSFEAHCPTYLRKRWVFDAYCDFQDFVTDDRFYGMIGPSAILTGEKVSGTENGQEQGYSVPDIFVSTPLSSATRSWRSSQRSVAGAALRGDDPEPLRHQVWELPQPQPVITEYQPGTLWVRVTCGGCGRCWSDRGDLCGASGRCPRTHVRAEAHRGHGGADGAVPPVEESHGAGPRCAVRRAVLCRLGGQAAAAGHRRAEAVL